VIAALAFSLQQTPMYTAQARLLVEPLPPSESQTTVAPLVNLETERELVSSVPVAEIVKEKLDVATPVDELLEDLEVEVVTETEVLIVGYTADDAAFAARAANAFAQGYIDNREQQAIADITAVEDAIQADINRVNDRLTEVGEQIAEIESAQPAEGEETADESLLVTLKNEEGSLSAQLGVLTERRDSLGLNNVQLDAGQVLAPAIEPTSPSSPNLMRNALLAGFLGLALGVGFAFLRERLQDRFKGREDVERVLGAPVLATIPRFSTKQKSDPDKLVISKDPTGVASEAYRGLRTNLEFISSTTGRNSFLITSPSAAEGKTVTTANLALAFAQSGRRTIVISADLRRPTIERIFGLRTEEGLSNYLAGQTDDLQGIIVNPGIPSLRILPTGPVPPNPSELMTSPRLAELVGELEEASDIVLIDCAPTLPIADATIVGAHVGGVVLVVHADSTRRGAADHAKAELLNVGGRLAGGVLNAFDPSSSPYSYYQTYQYDTPALPNGNGGQTRPKKASRFGFRR
jgi:polysaccharide biosynthesis transport protein